MSTSLSWGSRAWIMTHAEDAQMARVCRQQAAFASTREVHAALIELAEYYEGKKPKSVGKSAEPLVEEFE